ncbi:MAG: VWA domain-containing protein [Blastocatellia bacterium]|nr:VWA domain-containing protein [Blastocatellia bacterium]
MAGKVLTSTFLALLSAIPSANVLSVQQNENAAQREELEVRLTADLVLVPVEVTVKKTGLPVTGLKKEDFILFEDDKPQRIVFFGQDDIPLSLLLLVESRFIEEVARAARVVLGYLKPEDEVAIMVFHGKPCVIQELTREKDAVIARLEALAAEERNRGFDASESCWGTYHSIYNRYSLLWTSVYEGADYLLRSSDRGRRRAMIVFTFNLGEGDPRTSEKERRELRQKVLQRLYESDIVVSGVITSHFYVRFIWGVMGRPFFKGFGIDELVEVTGGRMGSAKPGEALNVEKLARLIAHLRAQYVLGYLPADATADGRLRRIKIELSPAAKKKHKDVELRYRQGYIYRRAREEASK